MNFTPVEHSLSDSTGIEALQLLHLADSALPIGAVAHSFGLETLVAEADLRAEDLPMFFHEWLRSSGRLEAAFCIQANAVRSDEEWRRLNCELTSFKLARESRDASLRLGRRFLALAALMTGNEKLDYSGDAHLAIAFGAVGSGLHIPARPAAAAFLHQALYGAIFCCQRLLPFGQSAAMRLLWDLKPLVIETVDDAAEFKLDDLWNLQPMLEIASMRHPRLSTRLFIS